MTTTESNTTTKMEIYDVFYQIMIELTPKEVGTFVATSKQANEYGLASLERYFKMCFHVKTTPNSAPTTALTVDYFKRLHNKILQARGLGSCIKIWSYSPRNTIKIVFDIENYKLIRKSLKENRDFTKVIRDLNPLNLVNWNIDITYTNAETTEVICYIVFRWYVVGKGDDVRKDEVFLIFYNCD